MTFADFWKGGGGQRYIYVLFVCLFYETSHFKCFYKNNEPLKDCNVHRLIVFPELNFEFSRVFFWQRHTFVTDAVDQL